MKFFLTCFFALTASLKAQDINYAKQIIDTLASSSMHGRGYVSEGNKIAANYIESEFKNLGLKPFNSYRQEFPISVVSFPEKMKILVDNQSLLPGVDFVLQHMMNDTFHGKHRLVYIDSSIVSNKKKFKKLCKTSFLNKVLIIDKRAKSTADKIQDFLNKSIFYAKENNRPVAIFNVQNKLTWHVPKPENTYIVLLDILPDKMLKSSMEIEFDLEAQLLLDYTTQNIIGYIPGSIKPDSFIVFSAHYDHLGRMGKETYFPGANDNASGCAMLLNLAKYYSLPENKPKYSIVFMAFGAEEAGILGSEYYVNNPLFPLKKIKFLINMDIMGTGDEGITVVNATEHKEEFETLVKINNEKKYLKTINPRGKTANSDHYFFSEKRIKTFFIYTMGGIKAYHDIYDRPETLPLTKFNDTFKLLTDFTTKLTD